MIASVVFAFPVRGRLLLSVRASMGGCTFGSFCSLFFRGEHAAHDRAIQFVGGLYHLAVVVLFADGKGRQIAFLPKHLMSGLYREIAFEIALAIGGLVAVTNSAPGEDADLVIVPRQ